MQRVHKVCEYLEWPHGKCKQCPSWRSSEWGKVKPGCRALAEECMRVAQTGSPFKKKRAKP
jgi:hypothetical protein